MFLPLGAELTAPAVLTFPARAGHHVWRVLDVRRGLCTAARRKRLAQTGNALVLTATVLLSLSGINLFGVFAPARARCCSCWRRRISADRRQARQPVSRSARQWTLNIGYGALFTCCYGLCALVAGLFHDSGRGWFFGLYARRRTVRGYARRGASAVHSADCRAVLRGPHVRGAAALRVGGHPAQPAAGYPDGRSRQSACAQTAGTCATEAAQAFPNCTLLCCMASARAKPPETGIFGRYSTTRAIMSAKTACCVRSAGSGTM